MKIKFAQPQLKTAPRSKSQNAGNKNKSNLQLQVSLLMPLKLYVQAAETLGPSMTLVTWKN